MIRGILTLIMTTLQEKSEVCSATHATEALGSSKTVRAPLEQRQTTSNPIKLYLVVRSDLPPAQQAVQAAHALTEYLLQHREGASSWHSTSNTLAFLSVPTEENLSSLAHKARRRGLLLSEFREPDRQHELTAVAFEPKAKSLLRTLQLALRL